MKPEAPMVSLSPPVAREDGSLLIVMRNKPGLYEYVKRLVAKYPRTQVMLDRRTYAAAWADPGVNSLHVRLKPGNDAVKVKFVNTLRQTQGKSAFAQDLQAIASDYK